MRKHGLAAVFLLLLSACGGGALSQHLPPQDRNGPCLEDKDCLPGFTCEGEAKENPGTCQKVCAQDLDCGAGALCREGRCSTDCAGLGEKCSERRICCFLDQNADGMSDLSCKSDSAKDLRCQLPKALP